MKKICPICSTIYDNEEIEYCPKHTYDHLDKFTKNMLKLLTVEKYEAIMNKSQQNQDTIPVSPNIPKCPICSSTNLKKLSAVNRGVSFGIFGFASNKVGKTYECRNCKATF